MSALALLLAAVVSQATPASPAQAPPASPAQAPPATSPGAPNDNYTYQSDGRRDPFINVLGTGAEPQLTGKRGDGAAGIMTAELSVRGVMQSATGLVALIQGPDKKTYLVHAGDKLMDGTVKAITPEGLVVLQSVKDPLSLEKTREVRRLLRSLEDARQ